jgi:hypothetical protein
MKEKRMNKRSLKLTQFLLPLTCLSLLLLCPQSTGAQQRRAAERGGKQVYRGNIVYIGGRFGTVTDFFTLTIDNYTPDDEVLAFTNTLKDDGQDGLWRKLDKQRRGTIQIGNNLSRDINAVWVTQTEDGRKISALAERWLGFAELRRGARSLDYPFTYIELWVEDDGDVEGSLFPAARVRSKGDRTLEIENFGIYPARLTNLKQTRK